MVKADIFQKNPMEEWVKQKVGDTGEGRLSREKLEQYQLDRINETIRHGIENSPYYRETLKNWEKGRLFSLSQLQELPFLDEKILRDRGEDLSCIPAREIKRIVTLQTSGSTGAPKRIWFTEEDQELTTDFFHHGMQNIINRQDRAVVFMPFETEGTVGDLLMEGIRRLGADVWGFGFLSDPERFPEAAELLEREKITAAIGTPKQMNRLAELFPSQGKTMEKILLSAEYVAPEVKRTIEESWACRVFEHYGMTEMGLGGAVSCSCREGYHIRENDLFLEIINPDSGLPAADGQWGEIVFTTLTRRGMPLIRYRTGDRSRILAEPCGCGSYLKRLDRVSDRGIPKNYENW